MSESSSSRGQSPTRASRTRSSRKKDPQTPQQKIDEFWNKYKTKAPGKATSIIPQNEFAERAARRASAKSKAPAKTTEQSYVAAAEQCRRKVAQIVKECRRVNQKYRDPHFDLELDQGLMRRDCLDSLDNIRDDHSCFHRSQIRGWDMPPKGRDDETGLQKAPRTSRTVAGSGGVLGMLSALDQDSVQPDGDTDHTFRPLAVKRIVDIFDNPQFFIDGPTANDVRQGRDGDCWLMAALCTLSNKPGLIERCCVAHDQDVGVYGFVFHRDGEWFSEIIDDKLYLTKPDYDESLYERILWEDRERVNSEEAYRKAYQSNSGALYFAQCVNPNETWLPLLEKAYAKAHGDYSAIEGGFGGEGIEDLTGGVTSEVYSSDILDKEYFWNEELMKVNRDFLFGCSTGVWGRGWGERKGIVELHAYSVLKACEIDGVRLVLLKNPWGKHEWKGPWSDGSKEWTAEWLQKLDHKFGDDGSFWISYEDLLKKYQAFDRTRLFSPGEWKMASIWTTLDISWAIDYHDTKFAFSLAKSGPVVIVLSQLDDRYFRGLQGQYRFELSFRVHKAGEEEYVVRSQNAYRMNRSVNVELDLEAGEYVVVVKIDAQRREYIMPAEEVVRAYAKDRREKLLRIGLAYDVAHSKGKIIERSEEKEAREAYGKRRRERERKKWAKLIIEDKKNKKKAALREKMKTRRAREKMETRAQARAERKAARREARLKEKQAADAEEKNNNNDGSESEAVTKPGAVEDGTQKQSEDEDARTGDKPAEDTNATDGKESQVQGAPSANEDKKPEKTLSTGAEATNPASGKPQTEDTATQTPTEEKQAELEVCPVTESQQGTSSSSTEAGTDTPDSSTISAKIEGDEGEDEEDYVTAAETDTEDRATPSTKGGPSTPKPAKSPASVAMNKSIGVQTGPGLPMPPPSPLRQGPLPPHLQNMYLPPPPPPGAHYGHARGPPRDYSLPPHLRAACAARCRPPGPPGPPASELETESSSSGTEFDSDADDVSEVSEHDIDQVMENARAATRKSSPPKSPAADEEPPDEFEKNPWNAVGVFGLRVYYKMAAAAAAEGRDGDEGVHLRVERPNPYVWDESSDEDNSNDEADNEREGEGKVDKEESKVLDVDDSAKDAVGEQPPTPSAEDSGEGESKAESKAEESKTEESKTEESKTEESKTEESKTEEPKTEESKDGEPKAKKTEAVKVNTTDTEIPREGSVGDNVQ